MSNPQIPQGVLNKLIASANFPLFSALNIIPSYLGKGGIHIRPGGRITENLPTMTGVVPSPEPFIPIEVTIELVRSQAFADSWKQQYETDSYLGNCTVWPDTTTLSPFQLSNLSITNMPDLPFNGSDPTFTITLGGAYPVNQNLYPG